MSKKRGNELKNKKRSTLEFWYVRSTVKKKKTLDNIEEWNAKVKKKSHLLFEVWFIFDNLTVKSL